MNKGPELHEVFTISGIPKFTFVKPEEYPRLLMALKTPGRGIVVEGPSGIGKTTAITKAMEEVGITENVVKLSARKPDDVALIKELTKMQPLGIVLIDDFHKLPDNEKKQIADLMKVLADEGNSDSGGFFYWLGSSDEWTLSLDKAQVRHPDFKGSLTQIIEKNYLVDLLRTVPGIADVVHYEVRNHLLTVEDPQFVFYLRNIAWDRFAEEVGYLGINFPSRYDFALSFAGSERNVAETIFANLGEREVEVFYDKNEQHRIIAEDVEDYLRPIYQSDAQFVVVLLSKEYPKRIWTKFESQQFKDRFKKGGAIPIWFSDAPPGIFDESSRIGGMTYNVGGDLNTQVAAMCETLAKRMTESRMAKPTSV